MNVKDLIAKLSTMPPDAKVYLSMPGYVEVYGFTLEDNPPCNAGTDAVPEWTDHFVCLVRDKKPATNS